MDVILQEVLWLMREKLWGMIAAQSIGEPGTQLTMRTFHIGGAAQINDQSFIEINNDGIFKILNKNTVEDSNQNLIVMGRNCQLVIHDEIIGSLQLQSSLWNKNTS